MLSISEVMYLNRVSRILKEMEKRIENKNIDVVPEEVAEASLLREIFGRTGRLVLKWGSYENKRKKQKAA